MRVCLVGSGGREHALALALARTAEVVCTPGNPGINGASLEGFKVTSVDTPAEEIEADLYVIGPEVPLVDGLADRLRARGKLVFGPGAEGARLEGSKNFMKQILDEAGVPTARYGAFADLDDARAFLRTLPGPFVVKTDGLAAGKGVFVTSSRREAEADIKAKLSGDAFGDAGRFVVLEEGLVGPEVSLLAVCDGERFAALCPAQDFKRARSGDAGPNTGGMGSYSPVPDVDDALTERILSEALSPTVAALRRRGIDYRGVLYAGIMLTDSGPKVLEYNVRFGDPETQVIMGRMAGDVAGLLAEVASGQLRSTPEFSDDASVCVVLAASGYPEHVRTGDVITGIEDAGQLDGVTVLHAGTREVDGKLVTAGGRVLGVRGNGVNIAEARNRAYEGVAKISWDGLHYRDDIAAVAASSQATQQKENVG